MIKNNTTAYPINTSKSTHTLVIEEPKIKISRMIFSDITKGLKAEISRNVGEIASMGKTTPDINNKMLPMEMEPSTPVSSDEKRYPIAMPKKVNTEAQIKSTKAMEGKLAQLSERKRSEIPSRIMICTRINAKFVK